MTTRRVFVRRAASLASGFVVAPNLLLPSRADHDLILRGGTVYDGRGGDGIDADLAFTNKRIAAIGRRLGDKGKVEIDVRGHAVAPGFVDIHSHGDGTLWDDPRAESLIRQGITTIVVGQDGGSRAPRESGGSGDDANRRFEHFGALWTALDELKPAVNVASMVGLGTVRGAVIGNENRPATPAEIERMQGLVTAALAGGACGVSSGLEYTPGAFASREELIELCKPLAEWRLPYATHMRNEDDKLLDAIDESIAVARGAGCPLQIAHLKTQGPRNWNKLDDVFTRIAAGVRAGMDITFDRYPYVAYQTGLTNLFPVWSRDGGTDAFLARLADNATASRIRTETLAKVELIGGWDNVQISGVNNPTDESALGQRLGAYAAARSTDPYVLATELLKRNRGSVGMLGFAMSEANLEKILSHPRAMVCSDGGSFATEGPARRGQPHPRSLGSFPRVLSRYVRERKTMNLQTAIQKMTSLPGSRCRIRRGVLQVGGAGDVVVFDPNTVQDRATFAEPFAYPTGFKAVIVSGSVALLDGERGVLRSGVVLRAS
jgi:N-acyl-D-amino-acid deacylase